LTLRTFPGCLMPGSPCWVLGYWSLPPLCSERVENSTGWVGEGTARPKPSHTPGVRSPRRDAYLAGRAGWAGAQRPPIAFDGAGSAHRELADISRAEWSELQMGVLSVSEERRRVMITVGGESRVGRP
jgi:hypothetical protein